MVLDAVALSLPNSIYAPEQIKACSMELEEVIAWRRRQEIKERTGIAQQANGGIAVSPELGELLGGPSAYQEMSSAQLESLHGQMRMWLRQPVTHITFPVQPTPPTKTAMVRWFRSEISPTALLKFEVNRNVVGGFVIRTPGRIFDFSFRTLLLKNRERIPVLLKDL